MRHSAICFNKTLNDEFSPYSHSELYPRLIRKHLARKKSNLGKAIRTLKTPSRQLSKREINRLSELGKVQQAAFKRLLSCSSIKQTELKQEESVLQAELIKKRVKMEDPLFDIENVFLLPSKCKRKKCEHKSSEQGKEEDVIGKEAQSVSMFSTEAVEVKEEAVEELNRSEVNMEDILYLEPEMFFREIDNLDCVDLSLRELDKKEFNDDFIFEEEIGQEGEKENELLVEDNSTKAPYVPPPFARVFGD